MRRFIEKTEHFIERTAPWAYLGLIIAGVVTISALAFFLFNQNRQIKHQAKEVAIQAKAIQKQRIDTTFNSCKDQNMRHKNAVAALNNLLVKSGVPQRRRAATAQPVLSLINALAPKRNCLKVVQKITSTTPTLHK